MARVPRKPRPKKTNVPKGYDSLWEAQLHQTLLHDWKHHWDNINYIVKHKYEPDFVKIIDGKTVLMRKSLSLPCGIWSKRIADWGPQG